MSLSEVITLNTNYTRSINLERDHNSTALIESYIPTSRSIYALQKTLSTLESEADMPRAWSLIGPYGSGKSSFAVFLSHLLANPETLATQAALSVLNDTDPSLKDNFDALSNGTSGHCIVLLTGSPEPLGLKLIKAVSDAALAYWKHRKGVLPKAVQHIIALAEQDKLSTTEIITGIKGLQTAIGNIEGNGLLIVIDELGKFLEYEARHPETNDIYLLQALAELAYTGGKAALSIYVILHQSFDQYAKGLGDSLKNEWAKVHGRFESIPFLEASEQTLRIVANTIKHDKTIDFNNIRKQATEIANTLAEIKALPSSLNKETATDLFEQCYPLHPISALILPILCQKVAQNERTLFNYLGSSEAFGFKKSLSALKSVGDWIYPWEIYEYFISNQSASLGDHFTHRRWIEVVTAVDRLGNIDSNETRLLKAIGLLNIIGGQGGFKASPRLIECCLPEKDLSKEIVQSLTSNSTIQYRRYNNEYRVWQGSDFDIEDAIFNETQKLGLFSVADYLNTQHEAQPVIARKFSIKTGTLRYFNTVFIDSSSYESLSVQSDIPRIIFYLSQDKEDTKIFENKIIKYFGDKDIIVEFPETEYLRIVIADMLALERIQVNYQELQNDPIAQHEFKDRYQAASQVEEEKFSEILEHPENSHWYWKGKRLVIVNKRQLQNNLSSCMEAIFSSTPIIKNELINRVKPTSQASAGRNRLLSAMVTSASKEDLGIEKFPAEKAIYRAVLRETGIHAKINGKWQFTKPQKGTIVSVWKAMESFLETTEDKPRSFSELANILTKPPYGIKDGLLPVFFLALYLVNKDEIALYEDRRYLPSLPKEVLERFVKKSKEFTVQLFKIEGLNASLFEHYSDALFPKRKPETIIQAVAPLAQFINDLDEYSKKTTNISQEAQAFRNAFNLAKSPESLLFEGIPNALGYKKVNNTNLKGYADAIKKTIQELKYAHANLLIKQRELLANAFQVAHLKDVSELRVHLRERYIGLERYTVDTDGLKAFINRLINKQEDDDKWFQSLLMLLGNKATDKWKDIDQNRAEMKLSDFSRRILDLETLRLEQEKMLKSEGGNQNFEVILLKSLKKGEKERTEAIAINNETHRAALKIKEMIRKTLRKESKDLQLATLAELVNDFLVEYQTPSQIELEPTRQKTNLKKVNNG